MATYGMDMTNRIQIIAEVGSVHDGSLGNAKMLIEAAASCGVDAVKFQTHIAEAETLPDAPMPPYFKGEPRFEYFKRTGFALDEWRSLQQHCDDNKVEFLSSPFSIEAVELLEQVGVGTYKIPSGEITNLPLLERIAQTGKPVLLSSGMSSWDELDSAVETVRRSHSQIVVMQCTSEYPCPYEKVGLNVMIQMKDRYNLPVGLSDHTLTPYACFAAAALGAQVLEKHFTFSRLMYGSDAPHSLEPDELTDLVQGVRAIETMMTNPVDKNDASGFGEMKSIFEKSLVSLTDIPAGAEFTSSMVGAKKPGTGIPAARFGEIIGKKAAQDIPADHLLSDEDIVE
jgi:N,N'-diacetyllegionaminate synthase